MYFSKHSPVVYVDVPVPVNTGEDVGSVQTDESVPVASKKTSEELIKRVQSPGSMGDSLLKVQLGPIFTWNTLPTVGATSKPSCVSPSTCNQKHAVTERVENCVFNGYTYNNYICYIFMHMYHVRHRTSFALKKVRVP